MKFQVMVDEGSKFAKTHIVFLHEVEQRRSASASMIWEVFMPFLFSEFAY